MAATQSAAIALDQRWNSVGMALGSIQTEQIATGAGYLADYDELLAQGWLALDEEIQEGATPAPKAVAKVARATAVRTAHRAPAKNAPGTNPASNPFGTQQ